MAATQLGVSIMPRRWTTARARPRTTLTKIHAAIRARRAPPTAAQFATLAMAWLEGTDPLAEATLIGYLLGVQGGPVTGKDPLAVDCGTHLIVAHLIPHRAPEGSRYPVLMCLPKSSIVRVIDRWAEL
jgi:hypothetical protein